MNELQTRNQQALPPSIFKTAKQLSQLVNSIRTQEDCDKAKKFLAENTKALTEARKRATPEEATQRLLVMIGCFPSSSGAFYGAVLLEEVMEWTPSSVGDVEVYLHRDTMPTIGGIDIACRSLIRDPEARFVPPIGKVLEELQKAEGTVLSMAGNLVWLQRRISEFEERQKRLPENETQAADRRQPQQARGLIGQRQP